MNKARLLELGYEYARQLPGGPRVGGEWLGLQRQILTVALCVGIDELGLYRTRFCYETLAAALTAFVVWDGEGDPPGLWIKQKPEERMNPLWLAAAKREMHE